MVKSEDAKSKADEAIRESHRKLGELKKCVALMHTEYRIKTEPMKNPERVDQEKLKEALPEDLWEELDKHEVANAILQRANKLEAAIAVHLLELDDIITELLESEHN